ncbi:MAG: hypothetical protein E6J59_10570 [Deltaproteobacteria bacterium]|nr:MAG: hypothetical protein E6J59_10570 [Deltaproteobacteria bacterium]
MELLLEAKRLRLDEVARVHAHRFGGRQESPAEFAAFLESGMDPGEVGRIAVAGIEAGTSSS